MVLEPLGIGGNEFRAAGCLKILDFNDTLPSRLAAERVFVILDESVNQIDGAFFGLHPGHIEVVPGLQIPGLVVFDQQRKVSLLGLILGILSSLFQFFSLFTG